MRIEHVSQAYRAELAKKVDATQKRAKPSKAAKSDQVQVSQDGKLLSDTKAAVEVAKTQVANSPEIRPEKVEEVKQKIRDGFYNSPEFAEKLADKLIQDIGKDLGIS